MPNKEMLTLNLNYTHRNLSPSFRRTWMAIGTILLITGSLGIFFNYHSTFWLFINSLMNIGVGLVMFFYSLKRLPWFVMRFIKITDDSVKFKLNIFKKRARINWDEIEQIEISSETIKIWQELASKPRTFSLRSVSYDDYHLLHKVVVDMAVQKDIELM